MTKMTYVNAIENALNGNMTEEVRERLTALKAQLAKKSAAPKKLTEQQEKNQYLKGVIIEAMARDKGYTVSEIIALVPELAGDSNQHVSALMRALKEEGVVVKYEDKRKSYFKLA